MKRRAPGMGRELAGEQRGLAATDALDAYGHYGLIPCFSYREEVAWLRLPLVNGCRIADNLHRS
jgi:hypothetical protein